MRILPLIRSRAAFAGMYCLCISAALIIMTMAGLAGTLLYQKQDGDGTINCSRLPLASPVAQAATGVAYTLTCSRESSGAVCFFPFQSIRDCIVNGFRLVTAADFRSDRTLWKGKTVLLDAGHGGHDPGAVRLGIREKDIALAMVLQLKAVLEARGAKVILTRRDDKVDLELPDICKIIAKVRPNVFISIHVNSSLGNNSSGGVQTYYREDCSRMLAHTLHAVIINSLSARDKGVYTCHFYVLNNPNIPSILIESGYISNRPDRRKLISPSYRRKFCLAIADGLERYWAKKRAGLKK